MTTGAFSILQAACALSLIAVSPATNSPTPEGPVLLTPTTPVAPPNPGGSLAPKATLPDLQSVQSAAIAQADLDPVRARKWLRAARRAAVLPTLDLSWEHRYDRGWQHDTEPGIPDELQSDHDAQDVWRVKLSWKLDRLWFNPDELRASRAQADLARWRQELLVEVTHLFFESRRARLRVEDRTLDAAERREAAWQATEVEGLLEGLCDLRWPQLEVPVSGPQAAPRLPSAGSKTRTLQPPEIESSAPRPSPIQETRPDVQISDHPAGSADRVLINPSREP